MPTYCYECTDCGEVHENVRSIKLGPEKQGRPCPACGAHARHIIVQGGGFIDKIRNWRDENGGRGRYDARFADWRGRDDPNAYFRTTQECLDHCEKNQIDVETNKS